MSMKFIIFLVFLLCLVGCETSCDSDEDCPILNSCEVDTCEHKDIGDPAGIEYVGYILMFILCSMSNAAGIGGGPVMLPVLLLIFYFETHDTIPLVQAIMTSGSLMSVILKIFMRHPTKDKPLIFYTLMFHIQSTMLLGTVYGVLLNTMFPYWLILTLLTIVLIFLAYNTFRKAIQQYKKEKHSIISTQVIKNDEINPEEIDRNEGVPLPLKNNPNEQEDENSHEVSMQNEGESNSKLQEIYKKESRTIEVFPFTMIIINYLIVVLSSFMQGGKGIDSILGFDTCSAGYWSFLFVFSLIMICFNIFSGCWCYRQTKVREELNYEFDEFDIKWTKKMVVFISVLGLVAGVLAGLIGLGGGGMLAPIMLMMHIRPEVSAGTAPVLIYLTASTSLIQFAAAGKLKYDYAGVFMVISVLSAVFGIFLISKIVKRSGRSSILVFVLFAIFLMASIAVPFYGIRKLVEDEENGDTEYSFESFC